MRILSSKIREALLKGLTWCLKPLAGCMSFAYAICKRHATFNPIWSATSMFLLPAMEETKS